MEGSMGLFNFGDFTIEETKGLFEKEKEPCTQEEQTPQTAPSVKNMSWAAVAKSKVDSKGSVYTQHAAEQQTHSKVSETPVKKRSIEEAFREISGRDFTHAADQPEVQQRGFVNQGNTCFQNVVLQALLSCPPLITLLNELSKALPTEINPTREPRFPTWMHMIAVVRELEVPSLPDFKTIVPKSASKKKHSPYSLPLFFLRGFQQNSALGDQEDAQEFLEYLLDTLHNEHSTMRDHSKGETDGNAVGSLEEFNEQEGWEEIGKNGMVNMVSVNEVDLCQSPITTFFKGTIRSQIQKSKRISATVEPFHCLHLDLKEPDSMNGSLKAKPFRSISQCLKYSMRREKLDESNIIKQNSLEVLPTVLTFHLKRFTFEPNVGPVKIDSFIEYPLLLEIPVSVLSKSAKQSTSSPLKYRLVSLISHHGMQVGGGHYTTVCSDKRGQWYLFDDDSVQIVSQKEALREKAYLLFYMRVAEN